MNRNRHRMNRNRHRNQKPRAHRAAACPEPVLHVWYVEPVGKIAEPVTFVAGFESDDVEKEVVQMIRGDLATSREIVRETARKAGTSLYEVEGVEGIAVIDPHWNGGPVAICGDPKCGTVHDVHLMTAENLYARAA